MRQSLSRLGPTALAIPGILAALALGGCKNGDGGAATHGKDSPTPTSSAAPGTPAPTTSPTAPAPSGSAAGTRLTVTVRASQTSAPKSWTLTCDPVGGSLPAAEQACTVLAAAAAKGEDPFAPTPKDQMCTQIYGGPQTATVTGTWNGKKIDATFNRRNGCEIKRWGNLASLFGATPPER
ncbi:SSI family serine proteinase inhibitor [Actinoallomurus rhizosphaericola]|uniref:SSI family serine proteinase inhibitor n=1 Tax=Actinoallomurus rhizosphaericola TaxID=2952536 RepID=UPI00209280FB|nr:SSI family serine proteinase inhibitor [Actinoallomurus rhizosphaericola]MCO5998576.1 SSI family serine proteinase inhibitor [Actinoallomurus rhizosphaericola]